MTDVTLISADGVTVFRGKQAGGGSQTVLVAHVQLTNADILGLVTTPFEVVAAPGAGKIIWPLDALYISNFVAPYGNVSAGGQIGLGVTTQGELQTYFTEGVAGASVSDLLSSNYGARYLATSAVASRSHGLAYNGEGDPLVYVTDAGGYANAPSVTVDDNALDDGSLNLLADNMDGDYSDGDPANVLDIWVRYSVIDLP